MSRVVVGMSGGVDSSVAAALLVEAGHDVIGITMHLAGSSSRCCSLEDADDARRVAERLGIPFFVANYTDAFRREVMEPFADAYLAGETPIPCVACNKRFKFDLLLARARALGAEHVATGHYARVSVDPKSGRYVLRRARDRQKDQSYFLYNLSQEQLACTLFPLGELDKESVRDHARGLGLATAEKPESQEICFVPDGDYARVVAELRPDALPGEGEIVDEMGARLGRHEGVHHFTVGQRRGLGLPAAGKRYVTRIDAEANRVVVGDGTSLAHRQATATRVSWTDGIPPSGALRVEVRVRHRHEPMPATLSRTEADSELFCLAFDEPIRAVTPGQAAVFYQGDRVLGGGTIRDAG
jgi:tRNA-specific 2-thiouridylase